MERSDHQENEKGFCNTLYLPCDEFASLPKDGF
jgi:hypothetical protein